MRVFTRPGRINERAFTMVEIALSLAVVGFALVAIMGVLPTGMTVQKDNREDVLINQEGQFWIEAIKGGGRGVEDLTNYVEEITITNAGIKGLSFVNNATQPLRSSDIIAILSTPRAFSETNTYVMARVKAITGAAAEKGPLTNEYSFRYQMRAEVMPCFTLPPVWVGKQTNDVALRRYDQLIGNNLWEIRLVLRWPVVERGNGWYVGNNRKTFRARIAGRLVPATNDVSSFLRDNSWQIVAGNQFNDAIIP